MWDKADVQDRTPFWTPKRQRRAGAFALVAAAHVAVFVIVARTQPPTPASLPPSVIDIVLMRPPAPPPPPPPPPPDPSPTAGGGAPAAPSRVHRSPLPVPAPELPAPVKPAPTPALNIGVSDIASPTPGMGQGGQGTGTGSGVGAGDGPGRGARTGPRNLRRPQGDDLRRFHPREALRRGVSGTAVVRCRILEDTTLDQCEIMSETPAGQGFGAAGLAAARELYRFRPATVDGQPDYGLRAVMVLRFGRDAPAVG